MTADLRKVKSAVFFIGYRKAHTVHAEGVGLYSKVKQSCCFHFSPSGLLHRIDYVHQALAQRVGSLHSGSLAIDADDRLGVALAEVYPTVGEVELHAVDVGYGHIGLLAIEFLDLDQDSVDIGLGGKVDAVLGDIIGGEGGTQLADGKFLLGQRREEQGDAHEGVATVVALRIDDSAIALAANDGTHFFHLGGDIDLAYCRSIILASVALGDVAQVELRLLTVAPLTWSRI